MSTKRTARRGRVALGRGNRTRRPSGEILEIRRPSQAVWSGVRLALIIAGMGSPVKNIVLSAEFRTKPGSKRLQKGGAPGRELRRRNPKRGNEHERS